MPGCHLLAEILGTANICPALLNPLSVCPPNIGNEVKGIPWEASVAMAANVELWNSAGDIESELLKRRRSA